MFWQKRYISLDIGEHSIKALDINEKNQIVNCSYKLLPRGVISQGLIKDTHVFIVNLKSVISDLGWSIRKRDVFFSLSGEGVIVKRVEVNVDSEDEITDIIESESEQYFRHNLEDLYYHWYVLPNHEETGKRDVILAGTKRVIVDQYLQIMDKLSLNVSIIDCGCLCLFNMFAYNYNSEKGLSLLINVGASLTQIVFIGNGEYLYSREIPIAGNNITEALAKDLKKTFSQAEMIKIKASEHQKDYPKEVLMLITNKVIELNSEIGITIDYFLNNKKICKDFDKIEFVKISGGGSSTYNFIKIISENFNLPTELINPFKKISFSNEKVSKKIEEKKSIYTLATGLSLRKEGFTD